MVMHVRDTETFTAIRGEYREREILVRHHNWLALLGFHGEKRINKGINRRVRRGDWGETNRNYDFI